MVYIPKSYFEQIVRIPKSHSELIVRIPKVLYATVPHAEGQITRELGGILYQKSASGPLKKNVEFCGGNPQHLCPFRVSRGCSHFDFF